MNTNDHLIDEMLSAFFKAQLPPSWPALDLRTAEIRGEMPMPASLLASEAAPARRVVSPNKSRMALAVSAALILGGLGYLSDRFDHHASKSGSGLGDGTASPKSLLKYAEPKTKIEDKATMP